MVYKHSNLRTFQPAEPVNLYSTGNSMKVLLRILSLPFIALIKLYQWVISPFLGPKCRFTPTCSQYAIEALKKHGVFKGLWLTIKRLSRCHPWGGHGYDPVP
jgi:uncharacterized protein